MHNFIIKIPARYCLWCALASGTALYFFANIQRVAIPGSVFNILQSELKVSAPYITAFGSSFMYIYAVNQLIIGQLVDRFGGIRVIAAGAFLFCAASLLFPFCHSLFMLYFCRCIIGLGASSIYLSLVKEIMHAFEKNFTIALSIMILIGYGGGIAANAPFVYCAEAFGWRMIMTIIACASFFTYILFITAQCGLKAPLVQNVSFGIKPLFATLNRRHNLYLFSCCGINFGLYYVLQTVIGKKFLEDYYLISSDSAAWLLSLMGITSALSGLGFALFSRMLGNRRRIFLRIVGLMCALVFSTITVLLFFEVRSVFIAVLMCLLACVASTSSIAIPLLRETNFSDYVGVAVSIFNFTFFIAVALFGNAVGFLMNIFPPEIRNGIQFYSANSYLAVFGTLTFFSFIVAWTAFHLRETMGKNIAETTV